MSVGVEPPVVLFEHGEGGTCELLGMSRRQHILILPSINKKVLLLNLQKKKVMSSGTAERFCYTSASSCNEKLQMYYFPCFILLFWVVGLT